MGSNVHSDDSAIDSDEVFHLARVALSGRPQDVAVLVRKYARRHKKDAPELAERLMTLLRETPTRSNPTRRTEVEGLPLDGETRLPLVRIFEAPVLDAEPVYDARSWNALRQIVLERQRSAALAKAGIDPTRTALFTGLPGVGKTLAALWIARELGRPLAILDLSAVMSSLLGRTGNNLRAVLDYARDNNCVLLLDELDAIAKRRDDNGEIGELKRLVTVLLQEIDEWPSSGLLLAATNHADLLDPAVWRRFEVVVEFPLPAASELERVLRDRLEDDSSPWPGILAHVLQGKASFSDAARLADRARRIVALEGIAPDAGLERVLADQMATMDRRRRQELAVALAAHGVATQRQASELTGVSRDTIRKHVHKHAVGQGAE